mgnify:FL=1
MKLKELERLLKTLGNARRLAILAFLKKRSDANVGAISEEINLSFRATSKHLVILANIGLVDREQRSLEMFYSLSRDLPPQAKSVISTL